MGQLQGDYRYADIDIHELIDQIGPIVPNYVHKITITRNRI